jgi:hypothetical protein
MQNVLTFRHFPPCFIDIKCIVRTDIFIPSQRKEKVTLNGPDFSILTSCRKMKISTTFFCLQHDTFKVLQIGTISTKPRNKLFSLL